MTLLQTDFELLEKKSELLKTLGHPIRLAIVELLSAKKKLTVTELYSTLEIDQPVASHHLRIMKRGGILLSSKDGKNTYYAISDTSIKKIFKLLVSQDYI